MTVGRDLERLLGRSALRVGPFTRIEWYPEVGSTNDVALMRADEGASEGLVVLADTQTAGRGRRGRPWISPPGAGLYLSALLRPPALVPLLTLAAGVAAAEAIETAAGLRPAVKWPNDLYVMTPGMPRKVGGILAEGRGAGQARCALVVGVGINVRRAAYPPSVEGMATSLESELGRDVDCDLLVVELLASLWRRYRDLRDGRRMDVLTAWRQRAAATFGRRIEWHTEGDPATGVIEDVDEDGALIVRADGGPVRIVSGEVRWIS